jgi:phage-related protein
VGLIQDIEQRLLDRLKQLFEPVIGPITRLWEILKNMFTAIVQVVPETIDLVKETYNEVLAWKDFKNQFSASTFKSGVINLQSVKDRIQDLITEMLNAWHGLVDLFTGGFKRVVGKPFEDAEAAAQELEELFSGFGKIGLSDFLAQIGPKLKRAGGKLFEVLAIIQAVAEELLNVVHDLKAIVDFAKDVRETFETGEGLFLKQSNKRKVLQLKDGGTIKIRLGKLHS